MLIKIISGGQTGADQGALDAAIKLGLPHGGWIPKGRMTEDGPLPERYNLQEMPTKSYPARTEKNIVVSDGTVILSRGKLTGGSALTRKLARKHNCPCLHINLDKTPVFLSASEINSWIIGQNIEILNVAGPRASHDPQIQEDARYIIEGVILLGLVRAQAGDHITDFNQDEYLSKLPISPKTVDEVVDRLISEMDLRSRVMIANMNLDQVMDLHSNLFVYLNKSFNLWPGNKELIESCNSLSKEPVLNGGDVAAVIIGVFWKRLQEEHKLRVV